MLDRYNVAGLMFGTIYLCIIWAVPAKLQQSMVKPVGSKMCGRLCKHTFGCSKYTYMIDDLSCHLIDVDLKKRDPVKGGYVIKSIMVRYKNGDPGLKHCRRNSKLFQNRRKRLLCSRQGPKQEDSTRPKQEDPTRPKQQEPTRLKQEKSTRPKQEETTRSSQEKTTRPKQEKLTRQKKEKPTKFKQEQTTRHKQEQATTPKQEKATKPKQEKPTRPKQEEPTRPKHEKPIRPKQERPTRPKQETSTRPKQEEPTRPKQETSTRPKQEKTTSSKQGKPTRQKKEKPSKFNQEKTTRPTQEQQTRPKEEKPTRPKQEKPTRPKEEKQTRPKHEKSTRPKQEGSIRPKQEEPTRPKQETLTRPKQEEPTRPKQETSTRPKQEKPTSPKQETLTRSKQEEPTRPKHEEPTIPKQEETTKSTQETKTRPKQEKATRQKKDKPTKFKQEKTTRPKQKEPTRPKQENPTRPKEEKAIRPKHEKPRRPKQKKPTRPKQKKPKRKQKKPRKKRLTRLLMVPMSKTPLPAKQLFLSNMSVTTYTSDLDLVRKEAGPVAYIFTSRTLVFGTKHGLYFIVMNSDNTRNKIKKVSKSIAVAIAVDEVKRRLFIVKLKKGFSFGLVYMNLKNEKFRSICDLPARARPVDIEVDLKRSHIYVLFESTIAIYTYSGRKIRDAAAGKLRPFMFVDLKSDILYYLIKNPAVVKRISLKNGRNMKDVRLGLKKARCIYIWGRTFYVMPGPFNGKLIRISRNGKKSAIETNFDKRRVKQMYFALIP